MVSLATLVVVLATAAAAPGSPKLLSELHELMTPLEVRHYLGHVRGHVDAEYELIYLPVRGADATIHKRDTTFTKNVQFEAFGSPYKLHLRRNGHLLHPGSQIVQRLSLNVTEEYTGQSGDCHFLHRGGDLMAAISSCQPGHLRGFVSDGQTLLDITPLNSRLSHVVRSRRRRAVKDDDQVLHLVRRTTIDDFGALFNSLFDNIDISDDYVLPSFINPDYEDVLEFKRPPTGFNRRKRGDKLTLELALFVDKPARETFMPFFENDLSAFVNFILGFINQVQALYYLPSLGARVDITINYLEVMEIQAMRHHGGERGQLLTSFCKYNDLLNKKAKDNQWDMGLYLSSLDFYTMKGGRKSPVTLGLAVLSGVCQPEYACVIGELGVTNDQGKPYPSAGFNAAFITAHEIGHNLGMSHDSQGNTCKSNGYIMSPSRGIRGETTWSACSRQTILDMPPNCLDDKPKKRPVKNHRIFRERPGQFFDAYDQCRVFLRDSDAGLFSAESLKDVCNRVKCRSPNRIGYYYAGPALEGTYCGGKKWCVSGSCRSWPSDSSPAVVQGGWSSWNVTSCSSGCLDKALGVSLSTRRCDNPKPQNTASRCPGPARSLQFCDDTTVCNYRMTTEEFAAQKCLEFSQLVPAIEPRGGGTQATHSDSADWRACAIYCRDTSHLWYTPREQLSDLGVDTFFPDGTWCHNDRRTGIDYYCQQHRCRPKVRQGQPGELGSFGGGLGGTTARPGPVFPPQGLTTTTTSTTTTRRPFTTGRPWWVRPTAARPPWTTTTRRWWTVRPVTTRPPTTTERAWFAFIDGRWQQVPPVTPSRVTRFPPRATRWPPRRAGRGATVAAAGGATVAPEDTELSPADGPR